MTYSKDREQLRALAGRQHGRVTFAQLTRLGFERSTIQGWVERGYLRPVLPRVYAVGHTARSREADLWAAVLYAGPGAALSHATAAHSRGLIDYAPRVIEVSTPRKVRSLPGVRVYGRREITRVSSRGVPTTSIPEMMVDLAATNGLPTVNRALGQLDFRHQLDVPVLLAACGSGQRGSRRLREALARYQPELKYANGPLEEAFLELCARRRLPLPRLNVRVHGILVDAHWPEAQLVVELDSEKSHSSPGQRRRDRRNDLKLRGHGLTVHRYDWELVHEQPAEVCADVAAVLERQLEKTVDQASSAARARTSSTISGGAVRGEPPGNGGSGSYSMPS